MDNFLYILLILLTFSALQMSAQEMPVYNHYYNNPYLFNPSEAGSDGFMSVKFNHRQQWMGIDGAPVVSTLTFQTPFDYKKWAFGMNIRNFERGLITTMDAIATYAYTVYLTKTTTLHFGLSAGVTSNSLNLSEIENFNDPVLADFQNDNIQPLANFGFKLKSKSGINFGISLPRLLKPNYINSKDFVSYDFSPFDEVLVMGYYKRLLDKKIVNRKKRGVNRRIALENTYAPLQFYVIYKYSPLVDKRIEVLTTLDLGEHIWIGGAYRLNYGPSGIFGIKSGSFSFSYAYEPSNKLVSGFEQGTHEIQIGLNIGAKKKLQRSKPILRTIKKVETHQARFSKDDVQTGGSDAQEHTGKHYYVVLKEFRDFNSADDFGRRIKRDEELDTDIFYNKKTRVFYVYIFETDSSKEANKEKQAVMDLTKFKKVKIITIDQ
jgi:type IX secretion system PorP/SprF family membrane protein